MAHTDYKNGAHESETPCALCLCRHADRRAGSNRGDPQSAAAETPCGAALKKTLYVHLVFHHMFKKLTAMATRLCHMYLSITNHRPAAMPQSGTASQKNFLFLLEKQLVARKIKMAKKVFLLGSALTARGGGASLRLGRGGIPPTPFRHALAIGGGVYFFSCSCPTLPVRGQVFGTPIDTHIEILFYIEKYCNM